MVAQSLLNELYSRIERHVDLGYHEMTLGM